MKKETNSARDIGLALNNAMALARTPASGAIVEGRMRRLSAYALALISPLEKDLAEELLAPHEAVFILASAAMMAHALYVQKTDKLPMLVDARKILEASEDEN